MDRQNSTADENTRDTTHVTLRGAGGHYPRHGNEFDLDIIRAELDDAIAAVEGDGTVHAWFDATEVETDEHVERTITMTYTPASGDD